MRWRIVFVVGMFWDVVCISYQMLRGLSIILWVKDHIVLSRELAKVESKNIRVCEITFELVFDPLYVTNN